MAENIQEQPLNALDAGADIQVSAPKSKTGLSPVGNLAVSPTQTAELLANMQQMINQRSGVNPDELVFSGGPKYNTIMGSLKDMAAWASGGVKGPTEGLALRDAEKAKEAKDLFEMRTQMASYKAAQEQAAQAAKRYEANIGGVPGVPGAPGAPSTGMTYAGIPVPDYVQAQLRGVDTVAQKDAIIQDWLKTSRNEAIKKENAPGMADVVDVYVNGVPTQMTKAMAEKYLAQDPNLQAVVGGRKVPAAEAINAVPAPAAATSTAPSAVEAIKMPTVQVPLENLTSPFYAQESSSGKADTSQPGIQGAQGPMQVTQDTLDTYKAKGVIPKSYSLSDPGQAHAAGTLILNELHKKHSGDINKIAAEYFGGSGAINADGSINVSRKDANGKTVGAYVNDIRKRVNAPAVEFAGAPAETTAGGAAAPMTRAEYERKQKEQTAITESRVKESEAERSDVLASRKQSIETGTALSRIESTLNTPEGVKAVGVFQKPGVVSMFGKILQNGIQAGNFGAISFKELDDAIRSAGGDQKTIDAAQRLARDFAQMQLNIAKRDLKGQGAVSDNERAIVAKVTGSTANSPEVLKDFVRWNKTRNDFDKQVGDALQKWEEKNPNQSFTKFKESAIYKQLENDYIAKTDAMASKMGISGGGASNSQDKTDEYLRQYLKPKGRP